MAPTGVAGGVDISMEAVAAPDVRELAAGKCAAFVEACEFLARASVTRCENCRRRLGENFAGLGISDKWSPEPAAAAWAPPGERPVILEIWRWIVPLKFKRYIVVSKAAVTNFRFPTFEKVGNASTRNISNFRGKS